MSRRLRDFIKLINREPEDRDDAEIGYFVPWLRRRSPLLKHLENSIMIDVIKHMRYMKLKRDDVLLQQGKKRHSYFLIFRGCVSMIVNSFIQSHSVRNTPQSMEKRLIASVSPDKMEPKSAKTIKSAKSKASSRMSFPRNAEDAQRISDISDAESEVSLDTMTVTVEYTTMTGTETITRTAKERTMATPASRASKTSKRETQRSRFGKCLVKYEKGKYVGEASMMDDEDVYTATLMADGTCDILIIDDDLFNTSIRVYHDKQVSEITHFVDRHPFFCHLTERAKTTLQICLSKHHYAGGSFIVKQGAPVNRLMFITSGSAELIVDPSRHRYQYPDFWPFETSRDIYYNEFEWLRESRKKSYLKQYEFKGEVTNKRLKKEMDPNARKEVSVAAVQAREVIGITEVMLGLDTHLQSVRCTQDCEVYTLNRKPFRKVIQKRSPDTVDLIRAYVHMKLQFRMERNIGDHVPLLRSLYVKAEREIREKSYSGILSQTKEKQRKREEEMMKLIEWFKVDKAELRPHNDIGVIQLKENMKGKAIHRQMLRNSIVGYRPFVRAGCLVAKTMEPKRAMSLFQLRHPIYEALLKLKADGTRLTKQELETFLMNYREPEVEEQFDIMRQADRVNDEEVNLLEYRREGNALVRRFLRMLDKGEMRNIPLTREETIFESVLLDSYDSSDDDGALPVIEEEELAVGQPTMDWRFESRGTESGMSRFPVYSTRPSTQRSLQFERRSVTPDTLERRIRNFHMKYGAKEKDVKTLPDLHQFDPDFDASPLPGGKVFVTRVPCVSCMKNVYIKNHNHSRCQMLHSLPMSKVRERSPKPRSPSYMREFSPLRLQSGSYRAESADLFASSRTESTH